MLYVLPECRDCFGQGYVGFLVVADGKTLVLTCDECGTVFLSPQDFEARRPVRLGAPRSIVPGLGVRLSGKKAHWATRAEIEARGWTEFIGGEFEEPHREGKASEKLETGESLASDGGDGKPDEAWNEALKIIEDLENDLAKSKEKWEAFLKKYKQLKKIKPPRKGDKDWDKLAIELVELTKELEKP